MKPLGCNVNLHAVSIVIGKTECSLGAEECLILHPDVVSTLYDNGSGGVNIARNDSLMANEIAIWMDGCKCIGDCIFWVRENGQQFVFNFDCCNGTTARLWMIGSNSGDGFAHVTHNISGKNRLVLAY
jgi:hypothetical protein